MNRVLDEFLDTVPVTQGVGVAINQSGKKDHSICVDRYGLLTLGKIGSTTHVGNDAVFDPDGLAFDKLSVKALKRVALLKTVSGEASPETA